MHSPIITTRPWPRSRAAWTPARWVRLEHGLRHGIWFAFFVALSPLLGPRDYGLFVLAASGVIMAEAVLGEYAAQALAWIDIDDGARLSTAFLALTAIGAALSGLLYAIAGIVATMVDDAGSADMFQALSLLPLLGALGAVATAVLRRRGSLAPFALATGVGLGASFVVAAALAVVGAGAWALVAQVVIQRFVEITILWAASGQRVALAWSRHHAAELVASLKPSVLGLGWAAAARQAPPMLVVLTLGPVAAGLYLFAARLFEALRDIGLAPLLATAGPVSTGGVRAIANIASSASPIAFPAVLGGAALLAITLPALLDPLWWGAISPARILLLAAVPAGVICVRTAALTAAGDFAVEARWQNWQALTLVCAVTVALPYGLDAVAIAVLAQSSSVAAASLVPLAGTFGANWRRPAVGATRPLLAAGVTGAMLLMLADPVGAAFAPLPASCLLAAAGVSAYAGLLAVRFGHSASLPATADQGH